MYSVEGRIRLRPVEEADAERVTLWRNAERDTFFSRGVTTPGGHRIFVASRRPEDLVWIVETFRGPVGMVSLTVDANEPAAEFGRLLIEPGHRGRRLGTETVYTALAYGFEILRLRSIWLATHTAATGACELYRKMHWTVEVSPDPSKIRMVYPIREWALRGRHTFIDEFGVYLDNPNPDPI